jgi:hypothetical protein
VQAATTPEQARHLLLRFGLAPPRAFPDTLHPSAPPFTLRSDLLSSPQPPRADITAIAQATTRGTLLS